MSVGSMLLMIAAVLVYCGLLQRVLDRLHLRDRQALLLIGAMLVGTFLPEIRIGNVAVNIGGCVIPLGVCLYLWAKADSLNEKYRMIWGSLLTAASIYLLSRILPPEAERWTFDPMWIYGLIGGVIAWMLGRSRRGAFVCGVVGVLLADIANAVVIWLQGYQSQLSLGGAGIADATIVSGVIGVLACELLGETIERFVRMQGERRNGQA